jgi:signal transduction histidine kinase
MAPLDQPELAADVALRLAGATDTEVDQVVTDALSALALAADADRAYVTIFYFDGTFENSHEWTASGIIPHRAAITNLSVDEFPYSYGRAATNQVVYAHTLADLPPEAVAEFESFSAFGVKTWLEVPVMVDGKLLGTVGFNHMRHPHEWDQESIDRVRLVARAIGVALTRRTANEQVRRSLESAERANRAKDDLIAHASHELRTPLHAVLGFAEILELDGVEHEALVQIRENGRLLLTMIDDLLELGRIGSINTGASEREALASIVERVVENLLPVAHVQQTALQFAADVAADIEVGAVLRLQQVVHCVASAAILAAGPAGAIDVTQSTGATGTLVSFACSGPSHRAPVGVGLALARSLAAAIDATVEVTESDSGVRLDVVIAP